MRRFLTIKIFKSADVKTLLQLVNINHRHLQSFRFYPSVTSSPHSLFAVEYHMISLPLGERQCLRIHPKRRDPAKAEILTKCLQHITDGHRTEFISPGRCVIMNIFSLWLGNFWRSNYRFLQLEDSEGLFQPHAETPGPSIRTHATPQPLSHMTEPHIIGVFCCTFMRGSGLWSNSCEVLLPI